MKPHPDLSNIAKLLGRRGGRKTAQHGHDYYVRIGKLGAAKRWSKHEQTNEQNNDKAGGKA